MSTKRKSKKAAAPDSRKRFGRETVGVINVTALSDSEAIAIALQKFSGAHSSVEAVKQAHSHYRVVFFR